MVIKKTDEDARDKAARIVAARFRDANQKHPFTKSLMRSAFYVTLRKLNENIHSMSLPPDPDTIDVPAFLPLDTSITAESLLKQRVSLIAVPKIIVELQQALNATDTSADEIARIISNDVKLTASLLRLVNSPLYGLAARVETISRAVTIVGVRQLSSLAVGATLISNISRRLQRFSLDSIWLHSIACAAASRRLAEAAGLEEPERFFVNGLLHDIGYLFMLGALPEFTERVALLALKEGRCVFDAEQHFFGFTHGEVGGLILDRWNLSEATVRATHWHHEPDNAPDADINCYVVHLADLIAKALGYHAYGDTFVPAVSSNAWDALGLDVSALDDVLADLHAEVDTTARVLLPNVQTGP